MTREFKEETGLATKPIDWTPFATIRITPDYELIALKTRMDLDKAATQTDEPVSIWDPWMLAGINTLAPPMQWLILLALDPRAEKVQATYLIYKT